MRGFLERLGARALGLGQVAQPIVPSIFDPGPGAAGGLPVAEAEAEPRHDRPTASAAAVPDPGPRSTEPARRDAREPAAWEGPRAARSEYEREHEHNGRAHDRGPWERAVETLPPVGREAAIVLAAPQEAIREHEHNSRAHDRAPGKRAVATLPPAGREAAIVLAAAQERARPEAARPEAADERWPGAVPSVVSRVAPPQPQPLSTRENHPTMERRHPAAATQGAPVIRVTIGRIDVRADVPAPAPARAATTPPRAPTTPPRAPTLSLDEYLKQRREGAR